MSPEIQNFLESDQHLVQETLADFSDFVLGELFSVGLGPDHEYCFMARLQDASEEVWEIRIYDTTPQLRFFGRFAEQDVFIALLGPLGKSKSGSGRVNYDRLKAQCTTEWQRLFTHEPVSGGDDINAYLSKNVDLV